uniref:RNA helicase n=1 Tax=Anopheles dirus TaxID=7168 RepID=A0A182NQY3_9DIPT
MSQVGDNNVVRITQYINPHCFWYKPIMANLPEHEHRKFATALDEHCESLYGERYEVVRSLHTREGPQPGSLVALRSNQLQRWIRCEVEELVVDLNSKTWYQLWAIDEGFPVKSCVRYIRPLPQSFTKEPAQAKRGAIINILPADTRYDYLKDEQVLEPSTSWCQGIVSSLEVLLEAAVEISIVQKAKLVLQKETIHFGELFITTQNNTTLNVTDLLLKACSNQMIQVSDNEYTKAILTLRTLKMKRFLNNEGIDKMPHPVNNFEPQTNRKPVQRTPKPVVTTPTEEARDTEVTEKVHDWLERNRQACAAMLQQERANDDQTEEVIHIIPEAVELNSERNPKASIRPGKLPYR